MIYLLKRKGKKKQQKKFFVSEAKLNEQSVELKLSLKKSSKDQDMNETLPKNLITFANYSYKGLTNSKGFYSPYLTLIQIPAKAEK